MSENGIMDRPRRSTRNSLATASAAAIGAAASTPSNSSNPYKKPTYFSNSRNDTPSSSSSKSHNGTPARPGRGRGRGRGRPPGRPSMSRGGHNQSTHVKPECVAVRVDGRRSTGGSTTSSTTGGKRKATSGGRRSTYNSRHEYDYHYGSDFESDHESEPEEEIVSEREESDADSDVSVERNDRGESDSDYSVSSSKAVSSRLPSPPVPIWLDSDKVPDIPKLDLPTSSEDLLLSKDNVVRAVEVYEPLRRFYQLVRLSPFRFEDFCAALASEDQSSLLAEIHIQLLRSVIREEESNGTLFGPNEVKDSIQPIVYFIDHITWPESLRSFLESDPDWAEVHEAIAEVEYPFCDPAVRIKVLSLLVDLFLTTNSVREQLLGEGNILHEDHCRACNRLGELICCENCPAVYHLECVNISLKEPPDEWKCAVCVKHQVDGVNDCASEVEKMGLLIRHERLGYDRHGRKYWFLVRRILVESEDGSEVWYYSTRTQLDDLLSRLDADTYESSLVSNIKTVEDEVVRQMGVTEEVTRQQNVQRRRTYLDVENGKENEGPDTPERVTRLKSTGLYKLGQDNLFRNYINLFTIDPLALTKGKQNEERDRKRHMSHKFSLTTASECKYGIKDITGCSRSVQITALKNALIHMENAIPTTLMHVSWLTLRKAWLTSLQAGQEPIDFSRAMIMISSCIRNAVYVPIWSESSGHVRLSRRTLMEREERKKSDKRDKKDKDDEEDKLKADTQFTKNPLPIRHQVYKQKGEEYRVHGRWGWIYLSNARRCPPQDCRKKGLLAGPLKHVIQVKGQAGDVKTLLIEPHVYNKLMARRSMSASTCSSPKSVASVCDNNFGSSQSTQAGSVAELPSTSSGKEQNSEKSSPSEKFNNDVDMENKEDNEQTNGEVNCDKIKEEKGSNKTLDEEKDKVEKTDDGDVAVKVEPMEIDMDKEEKEENVYEKLDDKTEKVVGSESTETDVAEIQDVEKSPPQKDNLMEEDMQTENGKQPHENDLDSKLNGNEQDIVSEDKPKIKGNSDDLKDAETVSSPKESSQLSPAKTEDEPEKTGGKDDSSNNTAQVATPAAAPKVGILASEKPSDDGQHRKFRTELVNVTAGLTSPHRILYPKIAKKSDYLDNLLSRKLTLKSLEEKQLEAEYGAETLVKAKDGIAEFEKEEIKLKQDEEEFPDEEVIDPNLTLGGAYKMCCYSSECRNEAKLFMQTKGKNRERLYEKFCYSPMCRLKFCLQETVRMKQEKIRRIDKEKVYKLYKEIEGKRVYTAETTSQKVFLKKLPDSVVAILNQNLKIDAKKTKAIKTPATVYPQVSSFQYAGSKKPSILVLPPFELRKLARTGGRHWNPSGFFPNQKPGSWGWSLPCGRPVFRTAWQYKATHAKTLGAAALQLRILYASIRWDDIFAKIPNTDGKNQVTTDTDIITSEILCHRIIGRFMEKVQYLKRMMVVPIDAPKTIREITPSRVGLRKRKRAQSPDKTEPVVTENWVDEERLELWEIRYYGERLDRKHDRGTPSASTRTRSGVAIKQPEKFDPSAGSQGSSEKKSYPAHPQHQANKELAPSGTVSTAVGSTPNLPTPSTNSYDSAIENVVRNHSGGADNGKGVSAIKTAELMRETIESELKMGRSAHVSKREKHGTGGKQTSNTPSQQPTASQQFQQQQLQQNSSKGQGQQQQRNLAQVVTTTPTTSKVGGVVVGKKFFASRQNNTMNNVSGLDTGILTKRPLQGLITINKAAAGNVSITKNPPTQPQQPVVPNSNSTVAAIPLTISSNNAQQFILDGRPLYVTKSADGKVHVEGLLPGQSWHVTPEGKLQIVVPSSAQPEDMQRQQQVTKVSEPISTVQPGVIKHIVSGSNRGVTTFATPSTSTQQTSTTSNVSSPANVSANVGTGIQQQQVISSQRQSVVSVSSSTTQVVKSTISSNTTAVLQQQPIQQNSASKSIQQVIYQDGSGRHYIVPAHVAPAFLQQKQQTAGGNPVSVVGKQIQIPGMKNPVIMSTSVTSAGPSPRIILQDGKAMFVSANSSPLVTNRVAGQVVRGQVVPTSNQQLIAGQGGIQLIQSGNGQIIISQQQPQPSSEQSSQQEKAKESGMSPAPSTVSTAAGSSGTIVTTPSSSTTSATQFKQVLSDGRTFLLTPTSTSVGTVAARPQQMQQQIFQSLSGTNQQQTIQIVQGPGGQQFILQQPANAQSFTKQGQQLQFVMPSGQVGAGQPILVKKFVKPGSVTTTPTSSSPSTTNAIKIDSTSQSPATIQNQLTQFLGPNRALIRLDNNQVAAVQFPGGQQTGSGQAISTSGITATMTATVSPAQPVLASKSIATVSTPSAASNTVKVITSTPTVSAAASQQNQTTITRTPGLPISIVSPSKTKNQQQQKSGVIQVISSNPSVPAQQVQVLPTARKSSAGVRVSTPSIIRTNKPAVTKPTAPVLSPQGTSVPLSTTQVFATKSVAPVVNECLPQQGLESTKTVINCTSVLNSLSAPGSSTEVIATKSLPPPLPSQDGGLKQGEVSNEDCLNHTISAIEYTKGSVTQTLQSQSFATVVESPNPSTESSVKKTTPNKIVAQIFQTPQGPKVILQGISPGELSSTQMTQLQQQIQKTLTSQQQQQHQKAQQQQTSTPVSSSPIQINSPPTSVIQQTPVAIKPDIAVPSSSTNALSNAQKSSPVESLRSVPTPLASLASPLCSPSLAQSPPPTRMVSPAKVLSPPQNYPNLMSPPTMSGMERQDSATTGGSLTSAPSTSPTVARKSAPRKSPITPNVLDSPPQIFKGSAAAVLSTPVQVPPSQQVNANHSKGVSNTATELMQPLNAEQNQILSEKKGALKEEILEKKKAAAMQMRRDAQREIQMVEKANAQRELIRVNERNDVSAKKSTNDNNPIKINESGSGGQTGRGKRKRIENYVELNNSGRHSTENNTGNVGATTSSNKKGGGPRTTTGAGKSSKKTKYCICKTPYDKNKFYVGCDKCNNWFHGDCIGVTEKMSKDLVEYICDDCQTDGDKLYCLCMKPYNDLQFYIQCDQCKDWLHGSCVGVLPAEADSIGDYSCPRCEPDSDINAPSGKSLDTADYAALGRVIKELTAHRLAVPFRKPVSRSLAPNYYNIIKEPMDLHTVNIRVEDQHYDMLRDFVGDLVKIFENCRYYNDINSDVFRQADSLEKFFVQKISALRQSFYMKIRQV